MAKWYSWPIARNAILPVRVDWARPLIQILHRSSSNVFRCGTVWERCHLLRQMKFQERIYGIYQNICGRGNIIDCLPVRFRFGSKYGLGLPPPVFVLVPFNERRINPAPTTKKTIPINSEWFTIHQKTNHTSNRPGNSFFLNYDGNE